MLQKSTKDDDKLMRAAIAFSKLPLVKQDLILEMMESSLSVNSPLTSSSSPAYQDQASRKC